MDNEVKPRHEARSFQPMKGRPDWEVSRDSEQWCFRERWMVMTWPRRGWVVFDLFPSDDIDALSKIVADRFKSRAEAMANVELLANDIKPQRW